MINRQIEVPQEVDLASLFGNFDENVKMLDKALSVNIASRDNALRVTGEEENVEKASQVINMLMPTPISFLVFLVETGFHRVSQDGLCGLQMSDFV